MAAVAAPPPSLLNQPPREYIHEEPETISSGENPTTSSIKDLYASYLGVSFAVFLTLLPESAQSLIPTLKCRNHYLSVRLHQAEEQLHQLISRRQEDSKANARVVEIFASHRNAWQREERRLIQQIDESVEENARLRERVMELERNESGLLADVDELKREIEERDEMLNFMSRKAVESGEGFEEEEVGSVGGGDGEVSEDLSFEGLGGRRYSAVGEERGMHFSKDVGLVFGSSKDGFDPNFLSSVAAKLWAEKARSWQDVQYESSESMYHMKHFVPRRESPWKAKGEWNGVSSKIKVLEQELSNLKGIDDANGEVSKIPSSLMRKQAKRYQDVAGKIDDLCKRMQTSDPCDSSLSSEFRTQRSTEFLLEAIWLQQRVAEAEQKLSTLEAEVSSSCYWAAEAGSHAVRRSVGSIKSNFREIQRNLDIWLARIVGDLEGVLARDAASGVREYCVSRCRYV